VYNYWRRNRLATMKKLITALAASLILCSASLSAQSYTTALGVRFGQGFGMTLQQVFAPGWTVEGILTRRKKEGLTHYTLLAEHHRKILGRRLNFYYGAGIQGGSYDPLEATIYENPFGLAGVFGLEFTIKRLNISFDFQPEYNLTGGRQEFTSDASLSLRYVLIKRIKIKKNKGNWKFWEKKKKGKKKGKKN